MRGMAGRISITAGFLLLISILVMPISVVTGIGEKGFAEISPLSEESYSPDEDIEFEAVDHGNLVYIWNFGDGSEPEFGREVSHNYSEYGTYTVVLICHDLDSDEFDNDTVEVKVEGIFGGSPLYMQVIVIFTCLGPFLITFLLLLLAAVILRLVMKRITKRKFELKKSMIFMFMVWMFLLHFSIMSIFTLTIGPVLPFMMLSAVVLGAIAWISMGALSLLLLPPLIKLGSRLPVVGKGLCVIRKPLPIQKKLKNGKLRFSKKNYMDFVLETSITPLFLMFFMMSLASYNISNPNQFWTAQNMLFIFLAPVMTFVIVPLQILYDSNIVWIRQSRERGAEIRYLGTMLSEVFRGVMGIGALGAFIGVFLQIGSGGELEQVFWAVILILMIVPLVYPGLFLVVALYSLMHNLYVKGTDRFFDKLNFSEYVIRVHERDRRHIIVAPTDMKDVSMRGMSEPDEVEDWD